MVPHTHNDPRSLVPRGFLDLSFTWGDTVLVIPTAPLPYRPGSYGSVCGLRKVDNQKLQELYKVPFDSDLYLVEFKDGEALQIPGKYLAFIAR